MIGPTSLGTIREKLRESLNMTDAELLAWFNNQMENQAKKSRSDQSEIDTLRLFRDALVREVKRGQPKNKARRTMAKPKAER